MASASSEAVLELYIQLVISLIEFSYVVLAYGEMS
jgi:hypothetical protein